MPLPRPLQTAKGKTAAFIAALLAAVATAIGTGIGDELLDRLLGRNQVVTASSEAEILGCGTTVFVADSNVPRILADPAPDRQGWPAFSAEFDGAPAPFGSVLVSIQGETSREVTLTRIAIDDLVRETRQDGVTFQNACGGPLTGRQIVFDLDRPGQPVVDSAEAADAILGARDASGRPYKRIKLPWTVSLDDPLLLRILVQTKRCDCTWSAAIDWRSGDKSGEINVDNGGGGFRVVGLEGHPRRRAYISDQDGAPWRRYRRPPS